MEYGGDHAGYRQVVMPDEAARCYDDAVLDNGAAVFWLKNTYLNISGGTYSFRLGCLFQSECS